MQGEVPVDKLHSTANKQSCVSPNVQCKGALFSKAELQWIFVSPHTKWQPASETQKDRHLHFRSPSQKDT